MPEEHFIELPLARYKEYLLAGDTEKADAALWKAAFEAVCQDYEGLYERARRLLQQQDDAEAKLEEARALAAHYVFCFASDIGKRLLTEKCPWLKEYDNRHG
jgi:hypothetical protein